MGSMPKIMAVAVMRIARRRPLAPSRAASSERPAFVAERSAKVTNRIELATAMPMAMMAPMNDCTLSVVPVTSSISRTPHSTAGMVSTIAKREADRLEVRGEQQKDDQNGQQQADA